MGMDSVVVLVLVYVVLSERGRRAEGLWAFGLSVSPFLLRSLGHSRSGVADGSVRCS